MKQSNLQFSDPRLNCIDFRVNNDEIKEQDVPISIEVVSEINPDANEAIVKLILSVGSINQDNQVITSFYFNGIIESDFKWNEKLDNPQKMLKISGGTVLLSYIRPILSNLTMQSGMKPLNLPFINFIED